MNVGPLGLPGRALVVCNEFPGSSQTWTLNHIRTLLNAGIEVVVSAEHRGSAPLPHDVTDHPLWSDIVYYQKVSLRTVFGGNPGAGGTRTIGKSIAGISKQAFRHPRLPGLWARAYSRDEVIGRTLPGFVHSHSIAPGYEYSHSLTERAIPHVLTFHGLHPKGVPLLSEARRVQLFASIARCFVNTKFASGQAQSIGCPEQKICIVPQGLNLGDFPFHPKPAPRDGEALRLVSVSRLEPEKGIEFALNAVAGLTARAVNVKYTVVGGGPQLLRLRALAEELGIAGRVEFTGWVSHADVARYCRESHILLLPSLAASQPLQSEETQGVVAQEAQASGALLVATRVGGIPECVDDGTSAWLVPDRDSAALASAVERLLRQPERWTKWQTMARKWVEREFDLRVVGPRVLEIYREVCQGL